MRSVIRPLRSDICSTIPRNFNDLFVTFARMEDGGEKLRRSSRLKTTVKNSKYSSDNVEDNGKRGGRRTRKGSDHSSDTGSDLHVLETELEKELENVEENIQKPTELFAEKQDVSGKQIYGFQTPSKKGAMAQKAALSRTPSTPKTLKSVHKPGSVVATAQTPHSHRSKVKKKLVTMTRTSCRSGYTSSESESVSEESEYIPSDHETSEVEGDEDDDENEDEPSEGDEEDGSRKKFTSPSKRPQIASTSSTGRTKFKAGVAYNDYHLVTDEYFESQSAKILTSDRTLGRLKNPRLDEQKLQELLSKQNHISKGHKQSIQALSQNHKSLFPMWWFIMEEGYSLLLHGLGSKRNLINDFHEEMVSEHPTLIVNGFFPSLTIKEVLDGIIVDLLGLESPANPNDCVDLIEKVLKENPADRLYLLVHNIDGVMLRSNKAQDTLSLLASIPNLCLMASVDHINTPLIWDTVKRSRYNFCWWDATTLLPYEAETSFESSLLVQRSGALALSSLRNVFLSLTSNARAIYILLVKHQLDNSNNSNYPGMAFKDLYGGAREAFLVSSDLALRAQLTEFLDHKLVRSKRNVDGAEYLIIPLDKALLTQFLEQQNDA